MAAKRKALTVRLSPELYRSVAQIAKRRRLPLNRLVQEGLEALARAEEQRRLYDAFSLIAEDVAETDVEFAWEAQKEVVTRDDEGGAAGRDLVAGVVAGEGIGAIGPTACRGGADGRGEQEPALPQHDRGRHQPEG